jgi:hypothetical protein
VLLLQAVINKLVYRRTSEQQYNLALARLGNPISMTTLTRAPATVVTRFLKGDVLQLDVRGNWHFPRDPLFGQFPAFYAPSPKGNWFLLSGGEYDSHLLLGSRAISVTAAQAAR